MPPQGVVEGVARWTLEVPADGAGELPAVVVVFVAAVVGGEVFGAKHEFERVRVVRAEVVVCSQVEGVDAVGPGGGVGLRADVAVCAQTAGGVASHGCHAEDEVDVRGDGVDGLQDEADVFVADAFLGFKVGDDFGADGEFVPVADVANGYGVFGFQAVAVGSRVARVVVVGVVEVMGVLEDDFLVAGFGDAKAVFGADDGKAFVFPAKFAFEAAAVAVGVSVACVFGVAGAVVGEELGVDAEVFVGFVGGFKTPVGVEVMEVAYDGAFNAFDVAVRRGVFHGEEGFDFAGFDGEAFDAGDVLGQVEVEDAGVGVVFLFSAVREGVAARQAAEAYPGVEEGAGVEFDVGADPGAPEFLVEGGGAGFEVCSVRAAGLDDGDLELLAPAQADFLDEAGVAVGFVDSQGVFDGVGEVAVACLCLLLGGVADDGGGVVISCLRCVGGENGGDEAGGG